MPKSKDSSLGKSASADPASIDRLRETNLRQAGLNALSEALIVEVLRDLAARVDKLEQLLITK
jgi:hypothetical protein